MFEVKVVHAVKGTWDLHMSFRPQVNDIIILPNEKLTKVFEVLYRLETPEKLIVHVADTK